MPVATRKKHLAVSSSTQQAARQDGILRFTRVSKVTKHATLCPKVSHSQHAEDIATIGTKRLRDEYDDDSPREDAKRLKPAVTPRKQRANPQSLLTPDTTPTKPVKWNLLAASKLTLPTPPTALLDTPPASPTSTTHDEPQHRPFTSLPNELYDLLQLNAALLQALSLQFAHTGSVSPIDVRVLRPSVTKIWGKRKATLDDIRRCLGVLHSASHGPVFHLYDYERGRICIERSEEYNLRAVIARHVDEDRLNEQFEHTLTHMWREFQQEQDMAEAGLFIADLPMEPIVLCPSLKKMQPRLAAGQRRLEDLKGISLERRTVEKVPVTAISQAALQRKSAAGVTDRSQSLLARLKAKEEHAATQPGRATQEQLDRKSALSRLHEIVPILAAPKSKASQRTTHALPLLVQTIQGSARNAMAKEEITHSLKLLCELAWGGSTATFVEMVRTGGVTAVIVDRTRRPTDWQARLDIAVDAEV